MKILTECCLLLISIASFVFSGFYFPWLTWASLVPILYLTYYVSLRKVVIYSIIFGIIAPGWLFYWIAYYDLTTYLASLILVASFYSLWPILSKVGIGRIPYPWCILVPPIVWSSLQLLYHFSVINSFWANAGIYAPMLAPLTWLIQGYGVAFLIVLFNSVVFFFIIKKKKELLIAAGLLGLIVLCSFAYSYVAQPGGEPTRIAIVQPNVQESFDWRANHTEFLFLKYLSLTESITQNPSIIIWPEYAFAVDPSDYQEIELGIFALSRKMNATIILGAVEWADPENKTFYDAISVYYANSSKLTYHSQRPLPFDKRVQRGTSQGLVQIEGRTVGLIACYEETQGELIKGLSDSGAQFFISLANNNHLKDSKGLELVSAHVRLHAAEQKKYLVRATNTGLTFITNPYGRKIASLPANTEGVLVAEIFI